MTTSETITLASAFESVTLSPGAASSLLQWLALQVGHDTEAGVALRDGGVAVNTPPPARSSTSKASSGA